MVLNHAVLVQCVECCVFKEADELRTVMCALVVKPYIYMGSQAR